MGGATDDSTTGTPSKTVADDEPLPKFLWVLLVAGSVLVVGGALLCYFRPDLLHG